MKTEALLRDPVFHLNLLIWMAKEQPPIGYRVRPLFFQNGFRLVYIEQPFAFSDITLRAIEAASLAISKAPEPEMVLKRDADRRALYFEAKASSFSPASDNSKQARGHLLACGPVFAEVLKPLEKALLCYVVPQDGSASMEECLAALSAELLTQQMAPGAHSVHGLALSGEELVYSWDAKFKQHCGLAEDSAVVLDELLAETDPSPLLLVFTSEDCPDKERTGFYRRVLVNQIVAKLVCDLHLLPRGEPYIMTARELLRQTSDGILDFLGRDRQNSMIRIVRQNIFARISSVWRKKPSSPVKLEADRLEITFEDSLGKAEFMDWLEDPKRSAFSDELAPEASLFLPGMEPGITSIQ